MSLINRMLQDLDKRHAADGGGKALTQQLRPVPTKKNWRRIMLEVAAGLLVGAGWAVWVLYQISPRSIVTDQAFQAQARKPHEAAVGLQAPVGAQSPLPPTAPASPPAAPPVSAATQAPSGAIAPAVPVVPAAAPGGGPAKAVEPVKIDMLKLATEIATPYDEKRFGERSKPERKPAAEPTARAKGAAKSRPVEQARAEAERELAGAAAKSGAEAVKADAHASIDKQTRMTSTERAEAQFRSATGLLKQGRVAEAIDAYKATLQLDTGHAAARQSLVGLLLEARRIDEAQNFLQEGLTLNPDRVQYAMLSARIQVERGDLQGAHELLARHAGGAASNADYHAFDAAVLQRLGRHKEAVAGYQSALKLAPKAAVWWMGIAISLQADNRNAEALEAFRRAKSVGGLSQDLITFVDQRVKQLQ